MTVGRNATSDVRDHRCLRCGATWRSKAAYVDLLMSIGPGEQDISCGITGHRVAMAALGRTEHPNNAEAP